MFWLIWDWMPRIIIRLIFGETNRVPQFSHIVITSSRPCKRRIFPYRHCARLRKVCHSQRMVVRSGRFLCKSGHKRCVRRAYFIQSEIAVHTENVFEYRQYYHKQRKSEQRRYQCPYTAFQCVYRVKSRQYQA